MIFSTASLSTFAPQRVAADLSWRTFTSVASLNFARESNDLHVQQQTLLDETLDVLLDVFSTVIVGPKHGSLVDRHCSGKHRSKCKMIRIMRGRSIALMECTKRVEPTAADPSYGGAVSGTAGR